MIIDVVFVMNYKLFLLSLKHAPKVSELDKSAVFASVYDLKVVEDITK